MRLHSRIIKKLPDGVTYNDKHSLKLYRVVRTLQIENNACLNNIDWLFSDAKNVCYYIEVDDDIYIPNSEIMLADISLLLNGYKMPFIALWRDKLWGYDTSIGNDNVWTLNLQRSLTAYPLSYGIKWFLVTGGCSV